VYSIEVYANSAVPYI